MQAKVFTVFAIDVATVALLYLTIVRRLAFPLLAKRLLAMSFLVAPAFIAIKGIESVVFASDILGVLLLVLAVRRWRTTDIEIRSARRFLLLLLVLWPLLMAAMVLVAGNDDGTQFNRRGLQGLGLWMYRNAVLLSVFVLASSLRLSIEEFTQFLLGFLVLSIGAIALAAINYLNIYNLAIFEQLYSYYEAFNESTYKTARTSWGFGYLGMFRGSMGQWYANSALVAVAGFMILRGGARQLSLVVAVASIGLVLISFSRAGLIATAVGTLTYGVLLGFRGWRLFVLGAVCAGAILPLLQGVLLQERLESIVGYFGSKEANRLDAWYQSLLYLSSNVTDLLIGVGPTNRVRVFEISGAYGAHNEYIDAVFRGGIGSFVILIGFLFRAFIISMRKYLRARDARTTALTAIAPALLVSNAVIGLAQDHLYRDYSGYSTGAMMFLLYGVLLSLADHRFRGVVGAKSVAVVTEWRRSRLV